MNPTFPSRAGEPSGLNQLKCRVEALKLDAGIGGCKAPVSFDIVSVAVEETGGNFLLTMSRPLVGYSRQFKNQCSRRDAITHFE
jgi:hypothetical protein